MEIVLTSENFADVISNNKNVLIDFWATWCGPCQMLSPVIEEIADEYDGKVAVCKCDVDDQEQLAMDFDINAIPHVFFVKDGEVVDNFRGYKDKNQVKAFIDKNL